MSFAERVKYHLELNCRAKVTCAALYVAKSKPDAILKLDFKVAESFNLAGT